MIDKVLFDNLYIYIYIAISLLAIFNLLVLHSNKKINNKTQNIIISFFLFCYVILFGCRDITVGTDTSNYIALYTYYQNIDLMNDAYSGDIGFIILCQLTSFVGFEYFFLFCSSLFILPILFVLVKIKTSSKLLILLSIVSMFYFPSLGVNIIRQGIAISLLLLAMYYYSVRRTVICVIYSILSISFHASIILIPLCFLLTKYIISTKYVFLIILCSIFLSMLGSFLIYKIGDLPFLNSYLHSKVELYVESDNSQGYQVGFRYDFFIFNILFLLVAYYLIVKKYIGENTLYIESFGTYGLLTAVFIIMFNFPYSDRFGVLSWSYIPYLMSPILVNKRCYHLVIPYVVFLILLFLIFLGK